MGHSRGRRVLLSLVIAFVVALGAPAGAAAAAATKDRSRDEAFTALQQRLQSRDRGTRPASAHPRTRKSVTETVVAVRDHRDREAWIESVAEIVEQRTGGEVATASEPDAASSEGEDPWEYTGSWADAAPAGDLDGDGSDDVIVYHYDLATDQSVLEARSGLDGSVLWEGAGDVEASMSWPVQVDLTGDGTSDLVRFDLDILSEEESGNCFEEDEEEYDCTEFDYTATYRWIVGVVSGADGASVWSRSFDGSLTESYRDNSSVTAPFTVYKDAFTYTLAGTNIDVLPFLANLDGQGRQDLILNALDLDYSVEFTDEYADAQVAYVGRAGAEERLAAVTTAELLDASSGDATATLSEDSTGMLALLYPLEHGDGTADLVWERAVYPDLKFDCAYVQTIEWVEHCLEDTSEAPSLELSLLDGATLTERWSKTLDGDAWTWPLGGDLDADGRNEIEAIVFEFDEEDEEYGWSVSTLYLSSGTGEVLWNGDGGAAIGVGPLDDAPGDDLLVAEWSWSSDVDWDDEEWPEEWTETETLTVRRHNGRTGATFGPEQTWTATSTSTADAEEWKWLDAYGAGDMDGDQAMDLIVNLVGYVEGYDEATDDWWYGVTESWSEAYSGLDARSLYRVESADDEVALWPSGDFDADGTAEVALRQWTATEDGQERMSFTPIRLTDGQALWTNTATGDWGYFMTSGDNDGVPGIDLVRVVDTMTNDRMQSSVTNIAGSTGQDRWTVLSRP